MATTVLEVRFLDLLEHVEEHPDTTNSQGKEQLHNPWAWSERMSHDLQNMVDTFCNIASLRNLGFSLTVADPSRPDCPLVACSAGFTDLTGYKVQEIVGRNCRFLLDGVPGELIDEETRMNCRAFCMAPMRPDAALEGEFPDSMRNVCPGLAQGEILAVQTNARKTGELFRNMFYMKHVELDESPYIVGLQCGLPEEFDVDSEIHELEKICRQAYWLLSQNMSMVEQLFAERFWYSAPMRRQT